MRKRSRSFDQGHSANKRQNTGVDSCFSTRSEFVATHINRMKSVGNNNFQIAGNVGVINEGCNPTETAKDKAQLFPLQLKLRIGVIVAPEMLTKDMRLFTMERDLTREWANKPLNFFGGKLEMFTHAGWLIFCLNIQDGWNSKIFRQLCVQFKPNLIVNLLKNERSSETWFSKEVGGRNQIAVDKKEHYDDWQWLCDCDEKHNPLAIDQAVEFSDFNIARDITDSITVFYPTVRIATCCASWFFSKGSPTDKRSDPLHVIIRMVIDADLTSENFSYILNRIGVEDNVIIQMTKTNSTEIVAVLAHHSWAIWWASMNDNRSFKYCQAPQPIAWLNLWKEADTESPKKNGKLLELNLNRCSPSFNGFEYRSLTKIVFSDHLNGVEELEKLQNLRCLGLQNVSVSDQAFRVVAKLTKLTSLHLDFVKPLCDSDWTSLSALSLKRLQLNGCYWFDESMAAHLHSLTSMRELSLQNCTQLKSIECFTMVDTLDISGCWQISSAAINSFQKTWSGKKVFKRYAYVSEPKDYRLNVDWVEVLKENKKRDINDVWSVVC